MSDIYNKADHIKSVLKQNSALIAENLYCPNLSDWTCYISSNYNSNKIHIAHMPGSGVGEVLAQNGVSANEWLVLEDIRTLLPDNIIKAFEFG